jgi:hypothetical protein
MSFILHPRPPLTLDVRRLSEADRTELRVVLPKGRRVRGRLVDAEGRALAKYVATAGTATHPALCWAQTDAAGAFGFVGVPDGPVTIGAYVADLDLEAREDVTISADREDLVLVARPIALPGPPYPVLAMGLRLVEPTEELRVKHRLPPYVHVMIQDPGVVGGLFNVGLSPGTGIWVIGEKKLTGIRDFVERIIAEYDEAARGAGGAPQMRMIRIVAAYPDHTNTQFFTPDARAIDQLRRLLPTLR